MAYHQQTSDQNKCKVMSETLRLSFCVGVEYNVVSSLLFTLHWLADFFWPERALIFLGVLVTVSIHIVECSPQNTCTYTYAPVI